jgi:hypothetical protein
METDLTLWVDAICINQHNDRENSRQVTMVGQIYRRCAQVRIWLGFDAFNCSLGRCPTPVGVVPPRANPFELILHMARDRHFGEWPCFRRDYRKETVYEDNDEFDRL